MAICAESLSMKKTWDCSNVLTIEQAEKVCSKFSNQLLLWKRCCLFFINIISHLFLSILQTNKAISSITERVIAQMRFDRMLLAMRGQLSGIIYWLDCFKVSLNKTNVYWEGHLNIIKWKTHNGMPEAEEACFKSSPISLKSTGEGEREVN